MIYKVRAGDNLFEIAKRYHVSVQDLKTWNHLKNNQVTIGKKLVIRKN